MYLELHKRGIRDIISLRDIISSHFPFLITEKHNVELEESEMMILNLERAYFEYFLALFGGKLEIFTKSRSRIISRMQVVVSKWIETNQILMELGEKDVQKCFDELWSRTNL